MAWPIAGPSSAGDSSSPVSHPHDAQQSPKLRKPRLRRRKTHVPRRLSPSQGLLTLLASIATSSVTAGCSPTPPAFLCPFLSTLQPEEHIRRHNEDVTDIDLDRIPQAPTPTKRRRKRHLPERYEKGDDGRYRRMDTYTLYGSTVCPECGVPTITSTTSFLDPLSDADAPHEIDLSTLPTGWIPRATRESRTTTLIVSLSLVLAFVICVFIISCLFWRKSRAAKYRENDVEMKALRRRKKDDEDDDVAVVQEAKSKQKLWARATARWKANARYTARQRRGKRSVVPRTAILANSTVSLPDASSQHRASMASSPVLSRPPSRQASIALPESVSTRSDSDNSPTISTVPNVSVSPPSPARASPPAYHQPLPQSQASLETMDSLHKHLHQFSDSPLILLSSSSSMDRATIGGLLVADDSISYASSINSAHVATDDKSLLARLGDMASEPPVDSVGSSALQVSAPVWQDETPPEFACLPQDSGPITHGAASPDTIAYSTSSGRSSSGFPLPPPPVSLKGKMAEMSYYEHSYSYDDFAGVDGMEPSAPPFDEALGPSAPPIDGETFEQMGEVFSLPSAPPLADELVVNCPQEDRDRHSDTDSMSGVLEYVDEDYVPDACHSFGNPVTLTPSQVQTSITSQDAQSSPPSPLTPSTSADYPRHRVSLIESSQDLVANDSVPLPRYQP